MDEDIIQMSKDQLVEEIKKMRAAIREHRDSTGQQLCWHHPKLWGLLPEKTDPKISVPEWPEFMKGCVRYRLSLDEQPNGQQLSKTMNRNPKTIALEFNDCINNRNIEMLSTLMTDDHTFIDTAENHVIGKQNCVAAWNKFFEAFPDYKNIFATVSSNGNNVTMEGHSTCSDNRLEGNAIWTAKIEDDKLSEWRVYEDTYDNRTKLKLKNYVL